MVGRVCSGKLQMVLSLKVKIPAVQRVKRAHSQHIVCDTFNRHQNSLDITTNLWGYKAHAASIKSST
ncbi:unnamed protein product [Natator depressus]